MTDIANSRDAYASKNHLSVITIFSDETRLQEVLLQLEVWKKPGFKVFQIMFEKTIRQGCGGFVENVTFALVFGKVNVFGGQLFSLQRGPVESELIKVISTVCCPSAKIAYISGEGVDVIKIHKIPSEKSDSEVTYYAPKKEMDKFVKKYMKKVLVERQEPKIFLTVAETQEKPSDEENISEPSSHDKLERSEGGRGIRKEKEDSIETDEEDTIETDEGGDTIESDGEDGTETNKVGKSLERNASTSKKRYCSPDEA